MSADGRSDAGRASAESSRTARREPARQAAPARRSIGRLRSHARIAGERASRTSKRVAATRPRPMRSATTCAADHPLDALAKAAPTTTATPWAVTRPIRTAPLRPSLAVKLAAALNVRAPASALPRTSARTPRPPAASGLRTAGSGQRWLLSRDPLGGRSRSSAPSPSAPKPGTNSPTATVTGETATRIPPPTSAERRRRTGRPPSTSTTGSSPTRRGRSSPPEGTARSLPTTRVSFPARSRPKRETDPHSGGPRDPEGPLGSPLTGSFHRAGSCGTASCRARSKPGPMLGQCPVEDPRSWMSGSMSRSSDRLRSTG